MANPASSTVSAGTAATATQYNNVRKDAIGQIEITTGEAYSAGDLLYIKASDGRAYKTDADASESGICEFPLIAAEAATAAAQTKLVYTPGRLVTGLSGLTAGSRYYPSSTAGALTSTEPAQTLYWRVIGKAISTTELMFLPQKLEYLPTGRQEKGFHGGGNKTDWTPAGAAGSVSYSGTSFKQKMVNVPSSETFTADSSSNVTAPVVLTASLVYGFLATETENVGSGQNAYYWRGSYTTNGN